MRIGVVDLDTSHPQNWIPIERALGHEVVGVWDGGSVHPAAYVEAFAAEHHIPRIFKSLQEMAPEVDCAIVHGCDWDTHVDKARPFIESGKAVLVDKPIAGRLSDLAQIRQWSEQGARIAGGSSLRYAVEVQEWIARPVSERGTPHTVFCGCGVDEFNYGIHAYSLLIGIMGGGVRSVRHLGTGAQRRILVNWSDGRQGVLAIGGAKWIPFHATIISDLSCHQFQVDSSRLYRALLEAVLPYLAGEQEHAPVSTDEWLEPELCALAARQSWLTGDAEVRLADLGERDAGYDGSSFADQYRKSKYS